MRTLCRRFIGVLVLLSVLKLIIFNNLPISHHIEPTSISFNNVYGELNSAERISTEMLGETKQTPSNISNQTTPNPQGHTGSECHEPRYPVNIVENQTFQPVDSSRDLYVFSAFFDDVEKNATLRIIGLSERSKSSNVSCVIWFEGEQKDPSVVSGVYDLMPDHHDRRYGAVFITCPFPDGQKPKAVSVVTDSCLEPRNLLKVIYSEKKVKFTVCGGPFHDSYSRASELVEWIEMNRMLGADYFTFYNYSTGVNVDKVLQLYVSKGLVNVVQWHVPMNVDRNAPGVHYFGQMASINDCVYRNLHRSEYIVFEDFDELIMPRLSGNWSSLLSTRQESKYGAFLFRCNFFRKDWPRLKEDFKGKDKALKYRSTFLLNTLREKYIFNYGMRSKLIVNPLKVDTMGIHFVWKFRSGSTSDNVSVSEGFVHHYRDLAKLEEAISRADVKPNEAIPRVKDMYMHTFADSLLSRLEDIWSQLKDVPMNIPLSKYPSPG